MRISNGTGTRVRSSEVLQEVMLWSIGEENWLQSTPVQESEAALQEANANRRSDLVLQENEICGDHSRSQDINV